ncbi:putative carboxylic ester hydrolase [Helianthus anomalus]
MISVACTAGNHMRKLEAIVERLGGLSYFAGAEKKYEKVLVPHLGSLTSIYDRARELFYYLKGGDVDYGEELLLVGRVYEQGHYSQWDEDHPIHFVGHSADARVIRVLQLMLADKAFRGYENTSKNWVLSVTPLSGAFNGRNERNLQLQASSSDAAKAWLFLSLTL